METSSDIQLRVFCRCVLKASLWLVAREILRYQPSAIKTKARQQVLMRFFVSSAPPSLWVGYTPGSHARSAASLAARSSSGCASKKSEMHVNIRSAHGKIKDPDVRGSLQNSLLKRSIFLCAPKSAIFDPTNLREEVFLRRQEALLLFL